MYINELQSHSVYRHFKLLDFVHNFIHINAIAVCHLSVITISTLKHQTSYLYFNVQMKHLIYTLMYQCTSIVTHKNNVAF